MKAFRLLETAWNDADKVNVSSEQVLLALVRLIEMGLLNMFRYDPEKEEFFGTDILEDLFKRWFLINAAGRRYLDENWSFDRNHE